jgi:hypothetical protein
VVTTPTTGKLLAFIYLGPVQSADWKKYRTGPWSGNPVGWTKSSGVIPFTVTATLAVLDKSADSLPIGVYYQNAC